MSLTTRTNKAPDVVERFLKALIVANKAVGLYPPSSTIPRETSEEAASVLREALRERSELALGITKEGMTFDDVVVLPSKSAYTNFAIELYNRRLAEVRFHVGATGSDLMSFLSVLKYSPEEIDAAGGFESRLWERNVTAITVTEVHVTIVDARTLGTSPSVTLTRSEVDQALGLLGSDRRRNNLVLERFLSEPSAVAEYLHEVLEDTGSLAEVGARFSALASVSEGDSGVEANAPRTLAEALACIDATVRTELFIEEILPEARGNAQVAEVLRQIETDDVFRMITGGIDPAAPPLASLARAIRQVEAYSAGSPGDIASAASAAMRTAGMTEEDVARVLKLARPETVTVTAETPVAASPTAAATPPSVCEVVDHAFTPLTDEELDSLPELAALREEAARGVTNGDVAMALVTLLAADSRNERFSATMTSLEAALNLVVDRGEIEAAADAAEALAAAESDPRFTSVQRERIHVAVTRLAKPNDIKVLVATLRSAPQGSAEHTNAARLLDSLGPLAIGPMLEQLANEPDMAARKSLIDLLSAIAPRYIAEVGGYVSDERWYVVRNVVSILGASRSSSAIPYLERSVRHSEPRVRRETIRALASINDRFAHQMLTAALTDEDAQNVQLAARYLGSGKVESAVAALERVAKGEGYGNRDPGPRVEAIESLGRMGAVSALPTLEALAGRRSLLQGGKMREIRAAADSAVKRIKTGGGA